MNPSPVPAARVQHTTPPLLRALKVDLRRSVCSPRFLLGVGLILAWLLINSATWIFVYKFLYEYGIVQTMDGAATGTFGLGMIVLALATIPYAASHLSDRECSFDRQIMERVGPAAYGTSRAISVVLSGFLAGALAALIFLLVLCCTGAPHVNANQAAHPSINGCYLDLAYTVGPWCFYLVRITLLGCNSAMAAAFGLLVSALIPNSYVVLLSPLLGYYAGIVLNTVCYKLFGNGPIFSLFVLQYIVEFQVSTNNVFSFLWAVVFQLTAAALCGWGFCRRIRKEQGQ